MSLILKAAQMAALLHLGRRRKYNNDPEISHPAAVAARLCYHPEATETLIAAAWLHDVLEDIETMTETKLREAMPKEVVDIVVEVTNPSKQFPDLSREERKAMDREHLQKVSREAKILKLSDRIHNISTILECPDKQHIATYLQESICLLEALSGTDQTLERELASLLDITGMTLDRMEE